MGALCGSHQATGHLSFTLFNCLNSKDFRCVSAYLLLVLVVESGFLWLPAFAGFFVALALGNNSTVYLSMHVQYMMYNVLYSVYTGLLFGLGVGTLCPVFLSFFFSFFVLFVYFVYIEKPK